MSTGKELEQSAYLVAARVSLRRERGGVNDDTLIREGVPALIEFILDEDSEFRMDLLRVLSDVRPQEKVRNLIIHAKQICAIRNPPSKVVKPADSAIPSTPEKPVTVRKTSKKKGFKK